MKKVISIIIPTYNMEEYLDKCLSSLLIKGIERVEIIIVNDGSSDNSLAIAQTYADKYPESFVVIDKKNGNYGSCVNAGLHCATGKYIKILDADDSFYSANFEEMVMMLDNLDVDLFLTDFVRVYLNKEKRASLRFPSNVIMDFTKECLQNIKLISGIWMHNITYKRENLIKIKYKQSEGIFYTDNEWKFKPMATVKSAYYWKKPIYRYILDREGQSVDYNVKIKHIEDDILVTLRIIKDFNDMIIMNPDMKVVYQYVVYRRVLSIYKVNLLKRGLLDNQYLLKFDRELKALDTDLYEKVGKKKTSIILLPFPYINIWRKNPNGIFTKILVRLAKFVLFKLKRK